MIDDIHAVVRNNAERSYVSITQLPQWYQLATLYIVQYHDDIDRIYQSCSNFSCFTYTHLCEFVCVPVFTSIQVYHVWGGVSSTMVKIQNTSFSTSFCCCAFL